MTGPTGSDGVRRGPTGSDGVPDGVRRGPTWGSDGVRRGSTGSDGVRRVTTGHDGPTERRDLNLIHATVHETWPATRGAAGVRRGGSGPSGCGESGVQRGEVRIRRAAQREHVRAGEKTRLARSRPTVGRSREGRCVCACGYQPRSPGRWYASYMCCTVANEKKPASTSARCSRSRMTGLDR